MVRTVTGLGDRLLAEIVPRVEAAAGCRYEYVTCWCRSEWMYLKLCMRGCPGVPDHCYPCRAKTGCR